MKNHEEIIQFIIKEVDLIISELTIMNAMLGDPELHTKPKPEEFSSRASKVCELGERMGFLTGKLFQLKEMYEFIVGSPLKSE